MDCNLPDRFSRLNLGHSSLEHLPDLQTFAVQGANTGPLGGGLSLPIDPSVTFARTPTGNGCGYTYARLAHPTGDACSRILAGLEGAATCLLTSSGMAAISATMFALLQAGEHLVAPLALYGGSKAFIDRHLCRQGVSVSYVDSRSLREIERALTDRTRLIWIESPSNPAMHLTDMPAVAGLARQRGILTAADNTLASPYCSRPLEMGVDVVVHSATKYLAGHGDLLAGAILCREELHERIAPWVQTLGCGLSAEGAWLLRRSLATFPIRMQRHCASAMRIAGWLTTHPSVKAVHYAGLPTHPQHAMARIQMPGGFGGVLSFELGDADFACRFLARIRRCANALSLGEPRTLIVRPAGTYYHSCPGPHRDAAGITEGLIRLAVGLEDPEDIIADLSGALDGAERELRSQAAMPFNDVCLAI